LYEYTAKLKGRGLGKGLPLPRENNILCRHLVLRTTILQSSRKSKLTMVDDDDDDDDDSGRQSLDSFSLSVFMLSRLKHSGPCIIFCESSCMPCKDRPMQCK